MAERLVGHDGPEVRAADADVDHVPDALAGVALPLAAADAVGEVGHLVEHGVHVRDDVLPVDDDRGVPRRAERDVEHGAVLGDVDLVAPEHGVDPLAQPRLLRQPDEQRDGLVGDAVLRVVEEEAGALGGQALAARRVVGEERPQVNVAHRPRVRLERLPRRAAGERARSRGSCLRILQDPEHLWERFSAAGVPAQFFFLNASSICFLMSL